jgi:hypothetical protein
VILSQSQSAQAARLFASAAPSPSVDEIQFQVIGDTTDYPARPFTSKTKAELDEGTQRKANQTRNQFESKFASEPEGSIFKDVLQIKPVRTPIFSILPISVPSPHLPDPLVVPIGPTQYDEKALAEELQQVTNPKIQPTVDVATSAPPPLGQQIQQLGLYLSVRFRT